DGGARLRRTHREGTADGIRAGAQSTHRTADGRGSGLVATANESQGGPAGAGSGVQSAVQGENPVTVPVLNKGQVFTSFDVEAFEVPSGRDEAWRFTPMRRLRGLHDGKAVADGNATIAVDGAADGVTVETVGRDDPRLGRAGAPADRVAAQAYSAFEEATVVTVGPEAEPADPVVVTV